jgi:TetR/AcrR family transcriptional repressor of nem operon
MAAARPPDTADRILDLAERLVQTQGFNGFSYADIAAELGIRKASLHHHFPTKAELARRLIGRYHDRFLGALAEIEGREKNARRRLQAYAALYERVLRDGERMCLCGMLAADFTTLPKSVREEVRRFFDANEAWLSRILAEGQRARAFRLSGSPGSEARLLLDGLEGAMLIARTYGDPARFESTARRLLAGLGVKA